MVVGEWVGCGGVGGVAGGHTPSNFESVKNRFSVIKVKTKHKIVFGQNFVG